MVELEFRRPRQINIWLRVAPREERITGGQDQSDDQEQGMVQHNADLLEEQILKKKKLTIIRVGLEGGIDVAVACLVMRPGQTYNPLLLLHIQTFYIPPGPMTNYQSHRAYGSASW